LQRSARSQSLGRLPRTPHPLHPHVLGRRSSSIRPKSSAQLEAAGLIVSGTNPDLDLVEAIELEDHPYFVAIQGHPEFQSKPMKPHPLFRDLIRVAWGRENA